MLSSRSLSVSWCSSVEWNGILGLRRLVVVRKRSIGRLDPCRLSLEFRPCRLRLCLHQIGDGKAVPERVLLAIAARLQPENFLEDSQIMRNGEAVARILVAEEIIEIVETCPG